MGSLWVRRDDSFVLSSHLPFAVAIKSFRSNWKVILAAAAALRTRKGWSGWTVGATGVVGSNVGVGLSLPSVGPGETGLLFSELLCSFCWCLKLSFSNISLSMPALCSPCPFSPFSYSPSPFFSLPPPTFLSLHLIMQHFQRKYFFWEATSILIS